MILTSQKNYKCKNKSDYPHQLLTLLLIQKILRLVIYELIMFLYSKK